VHGTGTPWSIRDHSLEIAMRLTSCTGLVLCLSLATSVAGAQTADVQPTPSQFKQVQEELQQAKSEAAALKAREEQRQKEMDSLLQNFSAGIAVLPLKRPEVETAEVRGGLVRVTDETRTRVVPWLQAQYIFPSPTWNKSVRPGLFVGVGLGANGSSFDTAALGVLFALKRTPWSNTTDTSSLNIGFGYFTTKYRALAADTPEGSALPTGVESIQYIRRNQEGLMLNISFSI
jgi:hypothetical protein